MKDLESLPCLTYEQGDQNSFYFSEEILSTLNHEKSIKVTDKGTIIDLMTGTDGYTISSGYLPVVSARRRHHLHPAGCRGNHPHSA